MCCLVRFSGGGGGIDGNRSVLRRCDLPFADKAPQASAGRRPPRVRAHVRFDMKETSPLLEKFPRHPFFLKPYFDQQIV